MRAEVQSVDSYQAVRQLRRARARPGRPEHRICDEGVPPAEPGRIPTATQQLVGRSDDGGSVVEQLSFGEAESLAICLDQQSIAGQIPALDLRLAVFAAVKFM